ncbi:DUF1800 domain-containing protein [Dyadobacter psychrotolerans]|uniref:DUF1800 domain-containing protein n=1 Tax=Dyadobacter psychrotolerans TaxID=2541721 RepID=A0A4R5D547_9BACT|nr:DUF1800 domain-containing protein [Dyadobacter psychrotolerans]TDE08552.1 DUF1800 domain-containing protein [Dyadobacter psychrotolerans]
MAYLNKNTAPLTAKTAAHLLRRATFGPTQQEIQDFVGLTPTQAVQKLIANVSVTLDSSQPIDLDAASPGFGNTYIGLPFNLSREFDLSIYVSYWWVGLMTEQNGKPSLLEKLTAFWQNHWVVVQTEIGDYRMIYQYLQLLRHSCLGNFRTLAIEMTKNAGMLLYQNGNTNEKEHPNENYARELQELFVVGQKDFYGNLNYTEQDVKEAARVLTGWEVVNHRVVNSISVDAKFTPTRHDTESKTFSAKYLSKSIAGRSGSSAGLDELTDLINILLEHPETPKFLCRKLYRWYVNPNVTEEIENNVIIPLAQIFAGSQNNYAIQPILEILLTSDIFYDQANIGAITKAPADLLVGTVRFFNQPVPNIKTDSAAFKELIEWMKRGIRIMQQDILDHPSVFGYPPYYQIGYSKNWINGATLYQRGEYTDSFVWPWKQIKPGYKLGIDILAWVKSLQPNFSDVAGTPAITCVDVLNGLTKNLFAVDLFQSQRDFLIDTIMMQGISRNSWIIEWNGYRSNPSNENNTNACRYRCQVLMEYMLRMAEYHIF